MDRPSFEFLEYLLSTFIINYYLSNKKDNPSEYNNQQSQTMRLLLFYPEIRLFAQNKSKNFVQDFLKYTRPYFRRLGSTRDENQNWEANAMKKKKMSDMTPRQLRCPHCGAVAIIRPASEIYDDPRRKDELYVCKNYPACKSYVGMHAGTRIPLGTLANGDLRNLRIKAHRRFDRIWQSGIMSRNAAYHWMADSFGLTADDAHIGKFGEYRCQQLIEQCDRILARNQKAAS